MNRVIRVRGIGGAVAILALARALLTAKAASAASNLVSCTGQEDVTYNPGLTFTPQDTTVTIRGFLGSSAPGCSCVAPGTDITSATYSEVFGRPGASCSQLAFDAPGTRTFAWNDGTTSTFPFTAQIQTTPTASTVTLTGTISAGRFQGHTAVEEIVIPQPSAVQCAGTGLTNSKVTSTLAIT